jgi:porin
MQFASRRQFDINPNESKKSDALTPAEFLNSLQGGDMKYFAKRTAAITLAALAFGANPGFTMASVAASIPPPGVDSGRSVSGGAASDDRGALQAQTDAGQIPIGVSSVIVNPNSADNVPPKGPLSGVGASLNANGINPRLLITNLYVANPSTGIETGKSADYFTVFFGADFDLEKLIGLPNTQVHFTEAWEPPGDNTVNFTLQAGSAFTTLVPLTVTNDLIKLTLSHDLLDRRLHVEYGRMNLTDDFFVPTMCAGCVVSTPAITELGVPGLTKSVWGARLAYALSPHSRLGLGVVENNSVLFRSSNGWNWSTKTREGYSSVANILYNTDFSDDRYPLKGELGVYYSTAPYSDALYNTDGSTQSANPMGTPLKHGGGTSGFYGQGRKVVWANGAGGFVPANIALYGGAFVTPGAGESYPLEAYGGVEYGGFLKDNPVTLVGSTVRYLQLSRKRSTFEQELSAITGNGNDRVHRDTFLFDLHAQHGIVPGVLVNGFAQYLLNPNRVHGGAAMGSTRSGWMFGIALMMDMGRITGLTSVSPR